MTHLRIHLVYLVLLGFLTYQYWTKTQALNEAVSSIEQFDRLFKTDNEVVGEAATMISRAIETQVRAYSDIPRNMLLWEKSKNAISLSATLIQWFESQKKEIVNLSGGFDKINSTVLVNRLSTKPSTTFFSNQKIQQIRDSLSHFQNALNNVADEHRLKELHEQYNTLKLLNDSIYWQKLKKGTAANALAQLTAIQNRIQLDKIPYLDHLFNNVGSNFDGFDHFKVLIKPKKAFILEGETFKADIFLASVARNLGKEITIFADGQIVPIQGNMANFKVINQSVGTKTVKVEARIRNPLTGQIMTETTEFEYEVLPKCSRDCR